MNRRENEPMPDRSKWVTPPGSRFSLASPQRLASLPVGSVLAVRVPLAPGGTSVELSVRKVSDGKWRADTGRGFPASHLVGAVIAPRVQRGVQS